MEKYYRIADLIVKMKTSGRTAVQAEPYLCDLFDRYDIEVNTEKMKLLGGITLEELWPNMDADMREYMASGSLFYRKLLNFGGMRLHSSAVVVDGKAYLFTADPGTGKSTHTSRYLELFGERAFILNDDKPAIRLIDGAWYAYGTPWSGKHDISVNVGAPIGGIAVLQRGEVNEITPFSGVEAIYALLNQVNREINASYRVKLMELLDNLLTNVPVWKLICNMDPEAAIVSYETMSGQKYVKENSNEN